MKRIWKEINPLFIGLWAFSFWSAGREYFELGVVDDFGNLVAIPAANIGQHNVGAEH